MGQASRFIRLLLLTAVAVVLLFTFTATFLIQPDVVFPDFSRYDRFIQTIPESHFPIHPHDNKRIIAVGDIHGMNGSLSALLAKISYDPKSDTLIHLGDVVSKSDKVPSDSLLTFLSTNKILGVRGNNDQKVVEWKAWMDWIASLPGGGEWLDDIDALWSRFNGDTSNLEFHTQLIKSHKKWKAYIPRGWKLLGKHYNTARSMPRAQYNYLSSLPLVLYAPAAHTYFVHAGLLPADPTRKVTDPRQPLSHWPVLLQLQQDEQDTVLRGLQEVALLNEIPQNRDPWVVMNMRSLLGGGKITDAKKGSPWSDLWNDVMGSCSSLPAATSEHTSTLRSHLHCFPSTVVYGHAAARDLDVKRWSMGVDTGCAYGRRLTAVLLDLKSMSLQANSAPDTSTPDFYIPYGDEGTAQITSVKCDA